jgi:hypothetical protein
MKPWHWLLTLLVVLLMSVPIACATWVTVTMWR